MVTNMMDIQLQKVRQASKQETEFISANGI